MVQIISLVTKEVTENDLVTQCEIQVKKTRVCDSRERLIDQFIGWKEMLEP
jgi:hypothetical protein